VTRDSRLLRDRRGGRSGRSSGRRRGGLALGVLELLVQLGDLHRELRHLVRLRLQLRIGVDVLAGDAGGDDVVRGRAILFRQGSDLRGDVLRLLALLEVLLDDGLRGGK